MSTIYIHEMKDPYDGFDENEIERPRKLQLDKIDDIEFDQVDMNDYPDFSDAYILFAKMDGLEMNDDELEALNENRDFVYEKLINHLF